MDVRVNTLFITAKRLWVALCHSYKGSLGVNKVNNIIIALNVWDLIDASIKKYTHISSQTQSRLPNSLSYSEVVEHLNFLVCTNTCIQQASDIRF